MLGGKDVHPEIDEVRAVVVGGLAGGEEGRDAEVGGVARCADYRVDVGEGGAVGEFDGAGAGDAFYAVERDDFAFLELRD